MAFAQDSTIAVEHCNSEHSTILKLQAQRNADPFVWIHGRVESNRTFDSVKAGNRQATAFNETLKAVDAILHVSKHCVVQHQLTDAGSLLDKLHPAILARIF